MNNILLVDDEQSFLEISKYQLEHAADIHVDTASSTAQAVEKMRRQSFDAVIASYRMPVVHSIEFLDLIYVKDPRIPFIIFSDRSWTESAIHSLTKKEGWSLKANSPAKIQFGEVVKRIQQSVERKEAESRVLAQRDLGIMLSESSTLQEALPACVQTAVRVSGMDCGGIHLFGLGNETSGYLHHQEISKAVLTALSQWWQKNSSSRGKAKTPEPVYGKYADFASSLRVIKPDGSLRAVGIVPLIYQDQAYGTLIVGSHLIDDIQMAGRNTLETIAAQMGNSISRIQAEDALRRSQKNLQTLFDSMADLIFVIDGEGVIKHTNLTASERLGYPATELTTMNLRQCFPAAYRKDPDTLGEALSGEIHTLTVPLVGKSRSIIPAETRIMPGRWNDAAIFFAISRDVTDQKRAEKELRIKDRAVASSINAIVLADMDGKLVYANDATLTMWQLKRRREILDKPIAGFWEDPAEAAAVMETLTSQGWYSGEMTAQKSDGTQFYTQLSASIVYDEDGTPLCLFASFADITESKEAAIKLARYARNLKASNRELEQFAYIASHDLQEPLRMVASYVQLLKRRYEGKLDSDADEFIEFAVDGAKRMQVLINDLLLFSRVSTRGKAMEPMDTDAAVKQALINLRVMIHEYNATVTHDPMPVITADFSQIVQLFQNLISNGIKFCGDKTPVVNVTVKRNEESAEWVFSVTDNGIGIEEKYFDKIFVIFKRLHGKTEYPGTGIGLTVCKRIVKRHSGILWVESEVGKGSTFSFTIPDEKKDLDYYEQTDDVEAY